MEDLAVSRPHTDANVDRPIRVLFASHGTTLLGGAERCLLELVRALAETGRVRPTVSVPRRGKLTDALSRAGVPIVVVPTPAWAPLDSTALEGPYAWSAAFRRASLGTAVVMGVPSYASVIRATRPDVVVTNTATIPTPALACRLLRKPHVWLLHEFVTLDHHLPYLFGEHLSQQMIGRLSAAVVANSSAIRQYYAPRVPLSKSRVIYYAVPGCQVQDNRLTPGQLRVLLLGRQNAFKGTDLAVRAVAQLAADEPRLTVALRLVGEMLPDYRREITELAEELGISKSVKMFEFSADPMTHIEWSNVVLMCSENEAFGRVTAEALKCGRPVIGTRSGGTPEIVTDRVDGLLFEPGDVRGLVACLRTLVSDDNLLETMSRNAKERSSARFLLEDEVNQFSQLLASVAARRVS